jgi:hypothetical protein
MRITSGGNVGIGTTSPTQILHVSDGTGATRVLIDNTANAAAGAGTYFRVYNGATLVGQSTVRVDNGGNFSVFTGTSTEAERMRITSGGYVGINEQTPNSYLHVKGSLRLPIATKTATYTLTADDYTVVFDLNGNATANLPDATTIPGRIYVIKINRTNVADTLTIDPNGAQTIDGFATYGLQCQYAVTIQSDGSNWRIISDFGAGLNCL